VFACVVLCCVVLCCVVLCCVVLCCVLQAACFAEVKRVVKPGGLFACYEWVMTDKYDPKNARHRAIKEGIEVGNGLPDIATIPEVLASLKKAGWEVIESFEMSKGQPHENVRITLYRSALLCSVSLSAAAHSGLCTHRPKPRGTRRWRARSRSLVSA
jgi:hypothetical protein